MLRCYSESLDRLFLPRGVADRAAKLIEKAGSRLAITDLRSAPVELEIEFTGTLRAEQQAAVDAVAAAHTFAQAIQSIPARRWLGLTATPKRADGREEIMFMHCGQVRHKIREPMLLAATASYIGEGFDCPALDTLFLCSPSSSESIITQNVGRIMRDLPGKTTVEVHDYADTRVAALGKRAYARPVWHCARGPPDTLASWVHSRG
jgi:hypothetical protein